MTIGVGFLCHDGIVICFDTQITWEGSHKDYERKIYCHGTDEWRTAFTYAGSPALMEYFDERFEDLMAAATPPFTVQKIQEAIETVLFCMDLLDKPDIYQLYMLCGIAVPGDGHKLLKTEQKIVLRIERYNFVGCGDGSLLRFLGRMLCGSPDYGLRHATMLAIYLTMKARTHADGCGGDTEGIVLRPSGIVEPIDDSFIYRSEQQILMLEKRVRGVGAALYDKRLPDEHFTKFVDALAGELKEQHFDVGISLD